MGKEKKEGKERASGPGLKKIFRFSAPLAKEVWEKIKLKKNRGKKSSCVEIYTPLKSS